MSTTRPRRKFTPEFKAEAVAMVEAAGGSIAQVAGFAVARRRVARIMREHGWAGVMGRIRVRTARRDMHAPALTWSPATLTPTRQTASGRAT